MDLPATCNKLEMAALLGVSAPTLAAWLRNHPDLPLVERGGHGRDYVFDPRAVLAWRAARDAAEREQQARRKEALDQLSLGIGAEAEEAEGLNFKDRRDLIRLRVEIREEAEKLGRIANTVDVTRIYFGDLAQFGRALRDVPRKVSIEHPLPEQVVRILTHAIDDELRRFVAGTEQRLVAARHEFVQSMLEPLRQAAGGP